jgi:hypothetical protein
MVYMVHLAIDHAGTFSVAAVTAPFTHKRSGASPHRSLVYL